MEAPKDLKIPSAFEAVNAMIAPALQAQGAPDKVMESWYNFLRVVGEWMEEKENAGRHNGTGK